MTTIAATKIPKSFNWRGGEPILRAQISNRDMTLPIRRIGWGSHSGSPKIKSKQ